MILFSRKSTSKVVKMSEIVGHLKDVVTETHWSLHSCRLELDAVSDKGYSVIFFHLLLLFPTSILINRKYGWSGSGVCGNAVEKSVE